MNEKVILTIDENIARITLNRSEKLNALNDEIWECLGDVVKKVAENPNVRVVILTGAGRIFCSGLDLSLENPLVKFMQFDYPVKAEHNFFNMIKKIQNIYNQIEELQYPVICAIKGAAIGGGLELALSCDLRFADEGAFFSIPEVKFGLIPDLGGTQRLTKIVGVSKAKELIYTGRRISAYEAKEIGLVNGIFKENILFDEVDKIAKEIAENGPLAVQGSKIVINYTMNYLQKLGLDLEGFLNSRCLISDDVKEGFLSYIQKRKPDFKGK